MMNWSNYFYNFLSENLKKYKIENLNTAEFLTDMNTWLKEIGWLKTAAEVYADEYEAY